MNGPKNKRNETKQKKTTVSSSPTDSSSVCGVYASALNNKLLADDVNHLPMTIFSQLLYSNAIIIWRIVLFLCQLFCLRQAVVFVLVFGNGEMCVVHCVTKDVMYY